MVDTQMMTLGIALLSTIVSTGGAYFTYEIYKFNRLNRAWLSVMWGLILAILVRIVSFGPQFGYFTDIPKQTFALILNSVFLGVSVLIAWGMWSMKKDFESFDIVEKEVEEKIENQ